MLGENNKGYLILEDGSIYEGERFGGDREVIGELVFTTSMVGYQETLTDPGFFGQIVMPTFPLIGNVGINREDIESPRPFCNGYVIRERCTNPSNFRSKYTIEEYLKQEKVPGISGLDTRSITKKLRKNGTMNAGIYKEIPEDMDVALKKIKEFKIEGVIEEISVDKTYEYESIGVERFHIVLYDYGYRRNALTNLRRKGARVTVVPYNYSKDNLIKLNPDGIFLSSGPGNPEKEEEAVEIIKDIIKLGIPIFGTNIGHNLLAIARGFKTEKLKYGHRGSNQSVESKSTGRVITTSQNCGYRVVKESIDYDICDVSYVNVNDGTCEGLIYKDINAETVSFDLGVVTLLKEKKDLYDVFLENVENCKEEK